MNNQIPQKMPKIFKVKSSFDEMTYIKNITQLLDSLNNNGNVCPI